MTLNAVYSQRDTGACNSLCKQQMEHLQYWRCPDAASDHTGSLDSITTAGSSSAHLPHRPGTAPVRFQLTKNNPSIFTITDVNEWTITAPSIPITSLIHLKHYRISFHSWLHSHYITGPGMNNASLSQQFIAHLSLLPNYYTLFWSVGFALFHSHFAPRKSHLLRFLPG